MQRDAGDTGLPKLLNEGIEQLGIAVTDAQRQKLLDYVALLGKWNAVYNLTAIGVCWIFAEFVAGQHQASERETRGSTTSQVDSVVA